MMQEKNIYNNKNISKKKSENIKIPKKLVETIKENYISINCNSNNNNYSILMNKPNVKIDLSKNYQTSNLRSISHSTKCMMKIKDRYKEKDKYQPIIKYNNNKYSIVKDNKKKSKEKKRVILKNIAIPKKYLYPKIIITIQITTVLTISENRKIQTTIPTLIILITIQVVLITVLKILNLLVIVTFIVLLQSKKIIIAVISQKSRTMIISLYIILKIKIISSYHFITILKRVIKKIVSRKKLIIVIKVIILIYYKI